MITPVHNFLDLSRNDVFPPLYQNASIEFFRAQRKHAANTPNISKNTESEVIFDSRAGSGLRGPDPSVDMSDFLQRAGGVV